MRRFLAITLIVISLAAAFAAGWWGSLSFYAAKAGAEEFVVASSAFSALRALRAGDTNRAIEGLEEEMDLRLMGLGSLIQAQLPATRRPVDLRLIARIGQYRAAWPRKTQNPEMDQYILDFFP